MMGNKGGAMTRMRRTVRSLRWSLAVGVIAIPVGACSDEKPAETTADVVAPTPKKKAAPKPKAKPESAKPAAAASAYTLAFALPKNGECPGADYELQDDVCIHKVALNLPPADLARALELYRKLAAAPLIEGDKVTGIPAAPTAQRYDVAPPAPDEPSGGGYGAVETQTAGGDTSSGSGTSTARAAPSGSSDAKASAKTGSGSDDGPSGDAETEPRRGGFVENDTDIEVDTADMEQSPDEIATSDEEVEPGSGLPIGDGEDQPNWEDESYVGW